MASLIIQSLPIPSKTHKIAVAAVRCITQAFYTYWSMVILSSSSSSWHDHDVGVVMQTGTLCHLIFLAFVCMFVKWIVCNDTIAAIISDCWDTVCNVYDILWFIKIVAHGYDNKHKHSKRWLYVVYIDSGITWLQQETQTFIKMTICGCLYILDYQHLLVFLDT